jgi:hypothetical protein
MVRKALCRKSEKDVSKHKKWILQADMRWRGNVLSVSEPIPLLFSTETLIMISVAFSLVANHERIDIQGIPSRPIRWCFTEIVKLFDHGFSAIQIEEPRYLA